MVRSAIVAVATAGVVFGTAGPAAAAPPVGGCPSGFRLSPASFAQEEFDAGNLADANGDFFACFRPNRGLTNRAPAFVNAFTVIDNVVRV